MEVLGALGLEACDVVPAIAQLARALDALEALEEVEIVLWYDMGFFVASELKELLAPLWSMRVPPKVKCNVDASWESRILFTGKDGTVKFAANARWVMQSSAGVVGGDGHA